jgi:hypothetical protein
LNFLIYFSFEEKFMDNPEQKEVNPPPEEPQAIKPPPMIEPEPPAAKPALVVNVYSWTTPVAAVLMLVVGLLLGYFGRPLLGAKVPANVNTPATQVAQTDPGGPATPTTDIMAYLVGQTHHFRGNESAAVTIIEFSDYQ